MKQTRYDTDLLYVQDISKVQKGENAIGMNCPNCGAFHVYHTVCPACGYYRGKVAIEKEA